MVGLAKLLLKIVINYRVWPVFMVVNNCKKIETYVSALKSLFWCMTGLAKLLLEIVINNRVWPVFMVVNNCKNIIDYVSALKIDFGVWGACEIIALNCYI